MEIGRIRSIIANLSLSLLSLLLCLLVVEVVLAWQYRQELKILEEKYEGGNGCSTRSPHRELIYTVTPGACRSNSRGYRDDERPFDKPDGVYRVVVIGDSVAWGQGVMRSKTMGRVLEKLLNEHLGSGLAQVITLAQSGYSTSQQLFLLQHEAFEYEPDLIVWSYVLNDPAHPVYHNANGELGLYFYRPRSYTLDFVARRLFYIRERSLGEKCRAEYHAFMHCVYRDEVASNIARIGQLVAARGVPAIFAIHPVFEEGREFTEYSLATLHAELAEMASASGMTVLDLLPAYLPYGRAELQQQKEGRSDPWHPNALGMRVAAEALYQAVVSQGLPTAFPGGG
jgi:lysophospholipase L1-like esterase